VRAAIHTRWNFHAVPVQRSSIGQLIGESNPYRITSMGMKSWAQVTTVVSRCLGLNAWKKFCCASLCC
jgi:hypothetical protein